MGKHALRNGLMSDAMFCREDGIMKYVTENILERGHGTRNEMSLLERYDGWVDPSVYVFAVEPLR